MNFKNGSKLNLVSEKKTNKHYFNLTQGKKFTYNFKNEKLFLEKNLFFAKKLLVNYLVNSLIVYKI